MKIIIIGLLFLIAFDSYSQGNRFEKQFSEADKAFDNKYNKNMDLRKLNIANTIQFELKILKSIIDKVEESKPPHFELLVIENGGSKYMGFPAFVGPYIVRAINQAYSDKLKEFEDL